MPKPEEDASFFIYGDSTMVDAFDAAQAQNSSDAAPDGAAQSGIGTEAGAQGNAVGAEGCSAAAGGVGV